MRRIVSVVLLGAFIAMLGILPAQAHASCDKASPPDGAELDSAPSEVYCDYTEPPASNSSMEVIDACGRKADDGQVLIIGPRMGVHMKATSPSLYTVRWHATSLKDGHKTFGSWTFTVKGTQAPCASPTPTTRPSTNPSGSPKGSTSSSTPRSPIVTPKASASATPQAIKPAPSRTTDARGPRTPSSPDPLSLAAVAAATKGSSPLWLFIVVGLLMSAMSIAAARFAASEDE